MIKEQQEIKEFMIRAGQDCPYKPTVPTIEVAELRIKLIKEELNELYEAIGLGRKFVAQDETELVPCNLIEVADAVTDLLVVTIGCAIACGIDIQPCWDEVHRSNMTKFIDGYKREDGKWIKGPSYSPANLKPIIEKQME